MVQKYLTEKEIPWDFSLHSLKWKRNDKDRFHRWFYKRYKQISNFNSSSQSEYSLLTSFRANISKISTVESVRKFHHSFVIYVKQKRKQISNSLRKK